MLTACTLGEKQTKPTKSEPTATNTVNAQQPIQTTGSVQTSAPVLAATAMPKVTPPQSVSITLGPPRQLMHEKQPDALGMTGIPDQPLTPILQPDKSYRLFIAGGEIGGARGGPALISTKDFSTFTAIVGNGKDAQQVFCSELSR